MSHTKIFLIIAAVLIACLVGGYLVDKNQGNFFEKQIEKADKGVIKQADKTVDSIELVKQSAKKEIAKWQQIAALAKAQSSDLQIQMDATALRYRLAADSLKHLRWKSATLADSLKSLVDDTLLNDCKKKNLDLLVAIRANDSTIQGKDNLVLDCEAERQALGNKLAAVSSELADKAHDLKVDKRQTLANKLLVVGEAVVIGLLSWHILTK